MKLALTTAEFWLAGDAQKEIKRSKAVIHI